MCADLVLQKRKALHANEIGLFLDSEVFSEEWDTIKQGEVEIEATQGVNMRQFRLFMALCGKIAKSGAVGEMDTRETRDYLLMKCRWVRCITTKWRGGTDTQAVVKSFRPTQLDGSVFNRIFDRAIYIITTEIIPDMPEGELRAEVEKMAGVSAPEPEPLKPPRQRKPRAMPAPVSVIPADEPVNASIDQGSPVQPAPEGPPPEARVTHSVPAQTSPAPAGPALPPPPAPSVGQAPLTKDFDGWKVYCLAWLEAYRADTEKTDQDCMVRWNAERSLRNECGITSEERQPVSEIYLTIVEEKRKGKTI